MNARARVGDAADVCAQGGMRTRPQRKKIVTSDRLAASMKSEGELCRERGSGWLHRHWSCVVHRVSTMQSSPVDHVKERLRVAVGALVSVTPHEWVYEAFPTLHAHHRGIQVDALPECTQRRSGRLPLTHVGAALGQGPFPCQGTISLLGVVQRRLAKQERHRAPRRSSWAFRPDADLRFSATGERFRVSPRAGNRPCSIAIGGRSATSHAPKSACRSPSTMSCTTFICPSLCRVVSSAPDLSCQCQQHQRQRRCQRGPRASAQSCHNNNAVHRLQQVSAVCIARAGLSAVRDGRLRQSLRVLL